MELEEFVKQEKGCWVRFMKLPPVANEAEAAGNKKAPPPKGGKGGAPADELKPVFGKAWINFSDLLKPGLKETK